MQCSQNALAYLATTVSYRRKMFAKWRPVSQFTSFAIKYRTRVKVTDCDKHSSLLQYGFDHDFKMFYSTGPGVKKLGHSPLQALAT